MLTQIGQKPERDFSEPIGMLEDCHKRIIYFLGVLAAIAETAGRGPLDDRQREALEKALRYFCEAAPRHTADEEESLFPRLRLIDDPQMGAIVARLDKLESDHLKAELRPADSETGRISPEFRCDAQGT